MPILMARETGLAAEAVLLGAGPLLTSDQDARQEALRRIEQLIDMTNLPPTDRSTPTPPPVVAPPGHGPAGARSFEAVLARVERHRRVLDIAREPS